MLKLETIKKDYVAGDITVNALKGVSLEFRKSEFVAILGPSGCGKTTMLNIVGGLDRYTSGDLIIKGRSTKDFKDRDWDTYRNHSVGFVFQSYNLIPHQTVLGNVELALTIAGMSKAERVQKAKIALDKVGLSDQCHKRPNQMSGGQMQRVAIARALVNDPEIVLADEPTGALDTVTSKQIMELLREISKDRLVVMVTHNPELAKEYSTRTIRLLDGELTEDSNPFDGKDATFPASEINAKTAADYAPIENKDLAVATKKGRYKKRTKMSFFTAFRLSLQNLLSKRKRSLMVSFAGSIGIIGVSLVLAFSFGIQGFITQMQRDMLSGNPIIVEQTTFDINAMMNGMNNIERAQVTFRDGFANVNSTVQEISRRMDAMRNLMVENTITEDYIRFLEDMPSDWLAAMHFDYGLNVAPNIFTTFRDHDVCNNANCTRNRDTCIDCQINERTLSLTGMRSVFAALLGETELAEHANMISRVGQSFRQLPANAESYILSQYNLVHGTHVAREKNEIMIVLGEDRLIADLLLAQLGYYSQQEFLNIVYRATANAGNNYNVDKIDTTIPDREDKISYEELVGRTFRWYRNDDIFIGDSTNPGVDPVRSVIVNDPQVAPFPIPFDVMFDYITNADDIVNPSEYVELTVVGILQPHPNMSFGMLDNGFYYTTALAKHIIEQNVNSHIVNFMRSWEDWDVDLQGTQPAKLLHHFTYTFTWEGITKSGENLTWAPQTTGGGMAGMMVALMGGGGNSIQTLGGAVFESGRPIPNLIQIYPANLRIKTSVLRYLDRWNTNEIITLSCGHVIPFIYPDGYEREPIMYQDILSLIFSMIRQMVNLITIALVSFTSLALVVSSVMIGIITYVSVVERIKEIGVIRSLGGRKRDVSNLFTAETFILGLSAGVFGMGITYIISWIASALVYSLAGIASIAFLPISTAAIMITLSVVLTSISGLLPSRSAAKKDPVIALRTE